jgi:energy-converting hydrogenase B subunit D
MPLPGEVIEVALNLLEQSWMTSTEQKYMIDAEILHIVIPILIVICALLVAKFSDLIVATIVLAALSLLLSLEFYILEAPDVAIAEAGIGAAITTAIFIIAIRATKRM